MKKKSLVLFAIAAISLSAVFIARSACKNESDFFEANVEALSDEEQTSYSVYGHCQQHQNSCLFICPYCQSILASVPDMAGPSYSVSGTCPNCQHSL